jgi:hypothetical protein
MAYGKTIEEMRAEYAPYDTMKEFDEGFAAYSRGEYVDRYTNGLKGQAFDRGAECAMCWNRQLDWERDNVGAN